MINIISCPDLETQPVLRVGSRAPRAERAGGLDPRCSAGLEMPASEGFREPAGGGICGLVGSWRLRWPRIGLIGSQAAAQPWGDRGADRGAPLTAGAWASPEATRGPETRAPGHVGTWPRPAPPPPAPSAAQLGWSWGPERPPLHGPPAESPAPPPPLRPPLRCSPLPRWEKLAPAAAPQPG